MNKVDGIRSKPSYDIIESMPDGSIKKYFNKHWSRTHSLANIIHDCEQDGYNFDKEAGMLFKPRKIAEEELNKTCLDIVFLRPSTLHYHPDVIELVKYKSGAGQLHEFGYNYSSDSILENMINGKVLKIHQFSPRRSENSSAIGIDITHGFKPSPKPGYLEIELVCSGILDMNQEVTIKPFNEW